MKFSEKMIGLRFQEETKYTRSFPSRSARSKIQILTPKIISLKQAQMDKGPNVWEVLRRRRSIREYSRTPLSPDELSNLLWATQGLTEKSASPWYRTAPSAGALHPIDTYLIINRVEDLEAGIYFFHIPDFKLVMKQKGDFSAPIAQAALDQSAVRDAAVVFVWVAVIRRSRQKYRQRAYRYIYLDCGHICQNLYLAATAMNLGCCGLGAFFDDEVNALVGVDGEEETAIYLATVGKKKGS